MKLGLHPANTEAMDERTRQMIADPTSWPYSMLPMKRRDGSTLGGYISIIGARDAMSGLPLRIMIAGSASRMVSYDTIDDALADGWTVD